MELLLPEEWIETVVGILRSGTINREILFTLRALRDWEAATSAWPYELVEAITATLEQPGVTGRLVEGLEDAGETYEFWIFFNHRRIYAKVCLLEGKIKVKVISAHRPLKGDKL